MAKLDGKVAIITGAASGMGAEHARVFVEEGAKVALTDINEGPGLKLAAELGENALFLRHDVTDPASWDEVVRSTSAHFGPVTVLVNNAGFAGPEATVADMSTEDYLKTIAIDQHGVFFGMRAVIPGMVEAGGGSIVNISSVAGFVHQINVPNPAYTAAKFAVRGLTKAAAVQFGPQGVRVNSVHPGGVLTPMLKDTVPQEAIDALNADVPLRRMAEPREVSQLVAFLASDDSSYITGAEHLIDGGQTAD
jgi:3alpha(or 20beta)-hydroxysteroid dehydrogenase